MKTSVAAVAIAAVCLTACVSTNATMLGASATGAKPVAMVTDPAAIAIYRTPDQVPGKYTEVALLNSTGDSNYTTEKGMFKSMRKQAAKVGANGIILDNVKEPGSGAKVAAAIFGVSAQRKGQSIAIVVEKP